MANKLMKKCLTSLVIMKMQIKGVKWQVLANTWSNWNFHIIASDEGDANRTVWRYLYI